MSIQKRYLKTKPVCKVTFRHTSFAASDITSVEVVGDFNRWKAGVIPMKKEKDGSFKATVDLETGRAYQFRYLVNGHIWENDPEADRYEYSAFAGSHNAVVDLS